MHYQILNKYLIITLIFILSNQQSNSWARTTHPEFDCTPSRYLFIFPTSCPYKSYEYAVECCCEHQQKAYKNISSSCYQCIDLPERFWDEYRPVQINKVCRIGANNDDICSLSYNSINRRKCGPGNRNIHQLYEAQVFIMFMRFIIMNVLQHNFTPLYLESINNLLDQQGTLEDVVQVNDGVCENPNKQSPRVINFSFLYEPITKTVLKQYMPSFPNLSPTQQYIFLLRRMIDAFINDKPPIDNFSIICKFLKKVNLVVENRLSDLNHYNKKINIITQEKEYGLDESCTKKDIDNLISNMSQSGRNHNTILQLWEQLQRNLLNYVSINTNWAIEHLTCSYTTTPNVLNTYITTPNPSTTTPDDEF